MKRFLPLLLLLALAGPASSQVVPTSPLNCGNFPALTGDVTSPATSCTTTLTAGSASNLNSGTVAAARGGAGTINGALKGNGAGVVSQAACADLSNGAASCSTDTTNATNISSGTLAVGRGGAGTINGALKANGAGLVSQAATGDLSDVTTPSTTCGANTPTLAFGGASVGITYSTRTCQYVKVGKLIIVELAITLTSKGSSTGAATLSGFPAAANVTTGACAFYAAMSGITGSLTFNGSGSSASLYMPAATVATALTDTNFTNTSVLQCTIPYISS